jgi:hypothetical protein
MKSSSAVETASSMEAASTAMAAAALGKCRRRRTKNHERKNCNENYRQGLLHFSPSNPTTRDCLAGTNFRRRHLRWQPTYRSILHPRRASSTLLPTQTATRESLFVLRRPLGRHLEIRFPNPTNFLSFFLATRHFLTGSRRKPADGHRNRGQRSLRVTYKSRILAGTTGCRLLSSSQVSLRDAGAQPA